MRAVIAGCALLLIGSAAQAQPYYGDGYPPPPYGDGYDHRPPPSYDDGYRHRPPPPPRYGEDFDRPPPRRHHGHCRIVEDFDGPHRICRPDFR